MEGTCHFVTDCSDRWCPISNASSPDTPHAVGSLMKPVRVINDCAASNTKCAVVISGCGWDELWKLTRGVKEHLSFNPFENKYYHTHHHQSWSYYIPFSTLNHTFMSVPDLWSALPHISFVPAGFASSLSQSPSLLICSLDIFLLWTYPRPFDFNCFLMCRMEWDI